MFQKKYFTIFVIMITEVLGFSLILPFLPFYAQTYGASPLLIGTILMAFSFFQFISAPIMGRLSDHYGRKPMLIFSQISTFASFIILGFANSLWMIFLSRIVDGMLGSNFTIAQAYISDISTKKDRSKAFGISGAAFGFGFLIGPAIGGYLSQFGYSLPSFIAAGISFITIITTLFFLPETIKRKKKIKLDLKIFNFDEQKKYFAMPSVASKLWIFFTYVLSHSIYVSNFALYAERQLNFTAAHIGFVLTFIGVISIILRGFLLSKIIDWLGEINIQYLGISFVIAAMILLSFANLPIFIIAMALFSVGSGLSRPVLVGNISKQISPNEQGSIMGVTSSLGSISQIIGPLVGGFMINYFFPGSLGIAVAVVASFGLLLTIKDTKNFNT